LVTTRTESMSTLIVTVSLVAILTVLGYFAAKEEYRLKSASIVFLVVLLLSSSTLSTEWGRMTSELVDNDEDPHYGLPDLWDGKQAVCFHFPDGASPSEFADGRHHIDYDGTDFRTDKNWNSTGACVGGFEGFENGLDLLNAAVEVRPLLFALNVTEFSFGLQINSIGNVSPCEVYTCAEDFSSGAYWELLNDGAYSMTGISDLALNSDTVITWQIASY